MFTIEIQVRASGHLTICVHEQKSWYNFLKTSFTYCIRGYICGGFIFREFRESDPRKNVHFNLFLFIKIVMKTSEKSRN